MEGTRRQILEEFEDGPVRESDLTARLDIPHEAVETHIEALCGMGFDIVSGNDGYELRSTPEYGPAVAVGIDAPVEVEYHRTIDSTNRRARELAATGAENVVVLADEQTGGRGRLDRPWASPSGGIWLSVLLRPDALAAHAPLYTLAAAVATTRAVREAGVDATIKWPNDVLVADRKLAGILTEMESDGEHIEWLVVGIGLNANVDPKELPDERATSLRAERGDVDRRLLTQRLLEELFALHDDHDTILPAWREYADTLGRRVRVETGDRTVVGEAVDIVHPGPLRIETADGSETVAVGDCEHLRPAPD